MATAGPPDDTQRDDVTVRWCRVGDSATMMSRREGSLDRNLRAEAVSAGRSRMAAAITTPMSLHPRWRSVLVLPTRAAPGRRRAVVRACRGRDARGPGLGAC